MEDEESYDSSFKTFDASDYSLIGTTFCLVVVYQEEAFKTFMGPILRVNFNWALF